MHLLSLKTLRPELTHCELVDLLILFIFFKHLKSCEMGKFCICFYPPLHTWPLTINQNSGRALPYTVIEPDNTLCAEEGKKETELLYTVGLLCLQYKRTTTATIWPPFARYRVRIEGIHKALPIRPLIFSLFLPIPLFTASAALGMAASGSYVWGDI